MEQEQFFSGYCRQLDKSRLVCVTLEAGALTDVDCDYHNCPHKLNCSIGISIEKFTAQST